MSEVDYGSYFTLLEAALSLLIPSSTLHLQRNSEKRDDFHSEKAFESLYLMVTLTSSML